MVPELHLDYIKGGRVISKSYRMVPKRIIKGYTVGTFNFNPFVGGGV